MRRVNQARHWTRYGIQGFGEEPPFLYDMYEGECLIVGNGRQVWEDLNAYTPYQYGPVFKAFTEYPPLDVMAVNDIGMYLPKVDHWVSVHDDILHYFAGVRKLLGGREVTLHGNTPAGDTPHCFCCGGVVYWHLTTALGCSGLLAVHIALLLGYERIVLAGVPADNDGNFYHPKGYTGIHGVNRARGRWESAVQRTPEIAQKVRSLSGFTRELLGAPDIEATLVASERNGHGSLGAQ